MAVDPEIGFTADVIRDPDRFVGRTSLIRKSISAVNAATGLVAVFGKRGVGKSSLLRQLQQMALGDYTLARRGGLSNEIPMRPRTYLTVYYTCDSMIEDGKQLLSRLINDQDAEDGLLRLVPNDGKEIVEFSRSKEISGGSDLKVVSWGAKGVETSKYARVVEGDVVQTFRNFVGAIVENQVKRRMKRDGLLIILDEFDVIRNKTGIGSLIKSLSTPEVKFAVCGVGGDLIDLIVDHASVERLITQGELPVTPMLDPESEEIISRASELFGDLVRFSPGISGKIAKLGGGFPYLVQLIGKECVIEMNARGTNTIDDDVLQHVVSGIKSGKGFPTLERSYQMAIGNSETRQLLLHLLAEQDSDKSSFNDEIGRIVLKASRETAEGMGIQYMDQLMPRLLDAKFGPVMQRVDHGVYEFVNPVLRQYIRLRDLPMASVQVQDRD